MKTVTSFRQLALPFVLIARAAARGSAASDHQIAAAAMEKFRHAFETAWHTKAANDDREQVWKEIAPEIQAAIGDVLAKVRAWSITDVTNAEDRGCGTDANDYINRDGSCARRTNAN